VAPEALPTSTATNASSGKSKGEEVILVLMFLVQNLCRIRSGYEAHVLRS
jgi:hypothetical protein